MPKAERDVTTLDLFDDQALSKDERQRLSRRAARKRWEAKNPDYFRLWHEKNREHVNRKSADRKRERYRTDPVYKLRECETNKRWRSKNRDQINAKAKEYAKRYIEADPDYRKKVYATLKRDGIMWRRARDRAKRHGWDFDLTREWIREQGNRCALTGLEFVPRMTAAKHPLGASIDRIDSKRGYTKDNCRLVVWGINRFKADNDDETILMIARALVARANN